ncbi:hypothetical protein ACLB1E_20900 [Escherichia coli]
MTFVLTPHIASGTSETFNVMADLVFDNLQAFLTDSQLLPLLLNKAENMIYGDITYLHERQTNIWFPVIARVIEYLSQHDLNSVPVGRRFLFRMTQFFIPWLNR